VAIVVGLTGGIGAGKSTFAALLGDRGAAVVDVDAIGREVIAPGSAGAAAVARRFGTDDRRELARIVFSDPAARGDLEAISWPLIEERLRHVVAEFNGEVLVLDMAVLPQGLGKGIYGPVVTVEAPDDLRLARLVERGMDADDAQARMRSQTSEDERRAIADLVVINDGSREQLATTADDVLRALRGWPS
jgi:dephospho-CoA kinase